MYTITLNDGTKLKNLELNGNNYISEKPIENSVFEGNLGTVTITDGKTTKTYKDMTLLSNRVDDGKGWFVLDEKSKWTLNDSALAAKVEKLEEVIVTLLGLSLIHI